MYCAKNEGNWREGKHHGLTTDQYQSPICEGKLKWNVELASVAHGVKSY